MTHAACTKTLVNIYLYDCVCCVFTRAYMFFIYQYIYVYIYIYTHRHTHTHTHIYIYRSWGLGSRWTGVCKE